MSWKETCTVDERMRFVKAVMSGSRTISGLCREFEVSRKTGYKWLERFEDLGKRGMMDQSRAPHDHPNQVSKKVEEELLRERKEHPTWGPRKILARMRDERPRRDLPAASTAGAILKRHGLVKARRARSARPPEKTALREAQGPNEVWTTDFKGNFLMGNGRRCHPLTIADAYSRFVIRCTGLKRPTGELSRPEYEKAFVEFGRPEVIRSDNGEPFASLGIGRLTPLSVWWMKLGIQVEHIAVGHPEQNGRHERMHRDLKQETTRPPAQDLRGQQRKFDRFVQEYNEVRPHEALGQRPPARRYRASGRAYPCQLQEPEYPGHYELRRVMGHGSISWRCDVVYVSASLRGETVGLVEVDDGVWRVYFGQMELGIIDEHQKRRPGTMWKVLPMCLG